MVVQPITGLREVAQDAPSPIVAVTAVAVASAVTVLVGWPAVRTAIDGV
ncbi:MAG: hypothetical protein ABSF26_29115 [Thermoguttaceae bacterium]